MNCTMGNQVKNKINSFITNLELFKNQKKQGVQERKQGIWDKQQTMIISWYCSACQIKSISILVAKWNCDTHTVTAATGTVTTTAVKLKRENQKE